MTVQTPITLFNKRLSDDRREIYFPTCIIAASFFDVIRSTHSTEGVHSENLNFKLRIPVESVFQDDRTYVNEIAYKQLTAEAAAEHWTIQKGDILLACALDLTDSVDEAEIKRLALANHARVITITEYADNTIRGSRAVQHWRIGGE